MFDHVDRGSGPRGSAPIIVEPAKEEGGTDDSFVLGGTDDSFILGGASRLDVDNALIEPAVRLELSV